MGAGASSSPKGNAGGYKTLQEGLPQPDSYSAHPEKKCALGHSLQQCAPVAYRCQVCNDDFEKSLDHIVFGCPPCQYFECGVCAQQPPKPKRTISSSIPPTSAKEGSLDESRVKSECCKAVETLFALSAHGIQDVLQSVNGRRNTLLQLHHGDVERAVAAAAADKGVEERELRGLFMGETQLFKDVYAAYKAGTQPSEVVINESDMIKLQELAIGRAILRMVGFIAPDHAKSLYLKFWKKLRKYSVIAALLGHDMMTLSGQIGVMKVMAGTADRVPDLWLQEATFAAAFEEADGLWDCMKAVFLAEQARQPANLRSDEATDILFLKENSMPLAQEALSSVLDPEPSIQQLVQSCFSFMQEAGM